MTFVADCFYYVLHKLDAFLLPVHLTYTAAQKMAQIFCMPYNFIKY